MSLDFAICLNLFHNSSGNENGVSKSLNGQSKIKMYISIYIYIVKMKYIKKIVVLELKIITTHVVLEAYNLTIKLFALLISLL